MADQIIRSSRSIGNNIAEGHGRYHYQDNTFCVMARGSLPETLDHLIIAFDEKVINKEQLQTLQIEYESCLKLINGYIKYLKSEKCDTMK